MLQNCLSDLFLSVCSAGFTILLSYRGVYVNDISFWTTDLGFLKLGMSGSAIQ